MSVVNVVVSGILIFILSLATGVTSTDHIVGANKGWNPGINYTLWSNNHTFYVNDFICNFIFIIIFDCFKVSNRCNVTALTAFRYQKTQYNVFQVNQTGYDNCTTESATGNWTSGKDFILLTEAKTYYFICGNGQCLNGMKVSVLVHPLATPPAGIGKDQSSSSVVACSLIASVLSLAAFILLADAIRAF